MVLCISSCRVSVSSNETDDSLAVIMDCITSSTTASPSGRDAPHPSGRTINDGATAQFITGVLSGLGLTISATLPPRGWVSSMHFVGLLALARPPRPPCMSVATVARLSRRIPRRVPPAVGRMSLATSSEGLSFRLHSLLSKTLLSGSVRPGTPRCEWQNCLSERFRFVSEADRDEILEERIEPLDVARRVGRQYMSHPLDSPLKRGISSTFSMNIPPASRLEGTTSGFVGAVRLLNHG